MASSSTYSHKMVKLQCFIESTTQKTVNLKLPSPDDWDKNLKSILVRIPKKFKFISHMNDDEWVLMIDGTSIDKKDAIQFGNILSSLAPPAIIKITKNIGNETISFNQNDIDLDSNRKKSINKLVISYKTNSFIWKPKYNGLTEDIKEWEKHYKSLINEIVTIYKLDEDDFDLFDEDECDIGCADDLMSVWQSLLNDNNSFKTNIKLIMKGGDDDDEDDNNNDTDIDALANDIISDITPKEMSALQSTLNDPNPMRNLKRAPSRIRMSKKEHKKQVQINKKFNIAKDKKDIFNIPGFTKTSQSTTDLKPKSKGLKPSSDGLLVKSATTRSNRKKRANTEGLYSHTKSMRKLRIGAAPKKKAKSYDDDMKLDEIKEDDDDDDEDEEESNDDDDGEEEEEEEEEEREPLDVDALLLEIDNFESADIEGKLIELGSSISLLDEDKKKQNFAVLNSILDKTQRDGIKASDSFEMLLTEMVQNEDALYVLSIFRFIQLLGYKISNNAVDGIKLNGNDIREDDIKDITTNFYFISNAMQKPRPSIYESLNIHIASDNNDVVMNHASGINCNKFIIFMLPTIVLENQQSSLVDKCVLDPIFLGRFINFLVPSASKYACKEIYFEKLKKMNVYSIGLFGSRHEVLNMLLSKYKAISLSLFDTLINDDENTYLQPGIHAILPVDLHKEDNMLKWDRIIYLFYFSLNNSFNMNKMRAVKYMRKDPSCLLSRVLYEISSTVCIQVTSSELHDFGVIESDEKEDKSNSKKKRRKGVRRRQKLNFTVEETKDNHIMSSRNETKKLRLSTTSGGHNNWKKFEIGDKIDVYSDTDWYVAKIKKVKKDKVLSLIESIYIHYMGWSRQHDEWIAVDEEDLLCECSTSCLVDTHLIAAPKTQTQFQRLNKGINEGISTRKIAETACDSFLLDSHRLSGFCQYFEEPEREGSDEIHCTFQNKRELLSFFNSLHKKKMIKWNTDFSSTNGIQLLSQCIAPKAFKYYESEIDDIDIQQKQAMIPSTIGEKVDAIIDRRNDEIWHEFHEFYVSKPYCYTSHQQILNIVKELGDISGEVIEYAHLKIKKKSKKKSIKKRYSSWREITLKRIKNEMKKLVTSYTNNVLQIKEDHRRKVVAIESGKKQEKQQLNKANNIKNNDIKKQQRKTIELWLDLYKETLREYKVDVYGYTKLLNYKSVKYQIESQIEREFDQEKQRKIKDLEDKLRETQNDKIKNMASNDVVTFNKFKFEKKHDQYSVSYLIPTIIPPSYYMQFTSIDLPDFTEEIRTNIMRNMQYEISRRDKIIFNQMMSNGDTVMFIESQNHETKQYETKIVASNSRILTFDTKPLKTLKKKRVLLVTYCESQKIFAILFEGVLGFCVFQDGGRISFTNKMSELQDLNWYNDSLKFRALLIEVINKNVFVYLIDENNICRAFDYDACSWDTARQFQIDQEYQAYSIPPMGSFLVCLKPHYIITKDIIIVKDDNVRTNDLSLIKKARYDLMANPSSLKQINPKQFMDSGFKSTFSFESCMRKWLLVVYVTKYDELKRISIESEDHCDILDLEYVDYNKLYVSIKKCASLTNVKTPSTLIEVHAFLLSEKKKVEYKITATSNTGYEKDNDKKESVDHALLPSTFSLNDIGSLNRIKIQEIKKDQVTICIITTRNELLYHLLDVQISEARMKINHEMKRKAQRKITKLDYMEYMMEKFGSRAAVSFPSDGILSLHTTYLLMDDFCIDDDTALCHNVSSIICQSLQEKERKDFQFLKWDCNVLQYSNIDCNVLNNIPSISLDIFIRELIMQLPIQVARGANNKFALMYNGADDQMAYIRCTDPYSLCAEIRFGAYDGLIKSWEGAIKIVTSMGKQSTGKSYMLNHLFGTKFDISGGRCTDGSWLSAKIIDDILFIICDFEGLGSFERSPQEDMLLATFNSAISNCTIFKCDNRFDRTVEDMFNKFQSGVKIMSGSQLCFSGELLLVIKDVVETGAEAAVADFNRHIERLAQESDVIINDSGKKESSFFVTQMYRNGLSLIPYPPLANEAFFTELTETLQPAFDDIDVVHFGGKQFLDHVKLIMAKLNIGDWSAMSGEQAKIRCNELRNNLQNAVEAGSIYQPKNTDYGVTFEVDDDQNLLVLDGNKVIDIDIKQHIAVIKNYREIIDECKEEDKLMNVFAKLNDSGLMLGKIETLPFLWQQFNIRIRRKHSNFKQITNLYQLFLDIVFIRRKLRVYRYIEDNTVKFKDNNTDNSFIESLMAEADSRLNVIRDGMKLCKAKCAHCFYQCLLYKNHEEDEDHKADNHSCCTSNTNHLCKELCTYCLEESEEEKQCADKCGHDGKHNCRKGNHTCSAQCSLSQYGGCQIKCNLESGHQTPNHLCAASTHYCGEKCAIDMCKNTCNKAYNMSHDQHICIQSYCPYKCQVQVWNERLNCIESCGRPCSSDDHNHELQMVTGSCIDEGHSCNREHPCPKPCSELGNCKVEIQRRMVEKEVFTSGAGSKIEYESYAVVNGGKRRCCRKIPVHKFKHSGDDSSHKCYSGKATENVHSCNQLCPNCGYFCHLKYGHYSESGTFHDTVHGNMRNTRFYAGDDIVDTGDGRSYRVGDRGIAEMCNIFCQRLGRGHVHLEFCEYHLKGIQCVEDEGRRHQTQNYKPNHEKEKDEVKHSKFWRRQKWCDPCLEKYKKSFELCPFVCRHISHREHKEKEEEHKEEEEEEEEDTTPYCIEKLWHLKEHRFTCKHPFANAHIIFMINLNQSMSNDDNGKSQPSLSFITLKNRLGSLYESIYKFIKLRIELSCRDKCSAIIFENDAQIVADHIENNLDFVQNYLLKHNVSQSSDSGTNWCSAFNAVKKLISYEEETIIIFITDGDEDNDNGASQIIKDLKYKMKQKLSLHCITLSAKTSDEIIKIANAASSKPIEACDGMHLSSVYISIAKNIQNMAKNMSAGAFM